MGEEVEAQEFSRGDRTRHREKVRRNLDVFARMLRESRFDTDDPMTGLEVELNLVDEVGDPALKNAEVLEAIADPDFQTELGQFNIEINLAPAKLREGGLTTFEQATDTRSEELKAQGVRPRVWFGERWITSVFDLFEENVRYFPALLPVTDEEDPL